MILKYSPIHWKYISRLYILNFYFKRSLLNRISVSNNNTSSLLVLYFTQIRPVSFVLISERFVLKTKKKQSDFDQNHRGERALNTLHLWLWSDIIIVFSFRFVFLEYNDRAKLYQSSGNQFLSCGK